MPTEISYAADSQKLFAPEHICERLSNQQSQNSQKHERVLKRLQRRFGIVCGPAGERPSKRALMIKGDSVRESQNNSFRHTELFDVLKDRSVDTALLRLEQMESKRDTEVSNDLRKFPVPILDNLNGENLLKFEKREGGIISHTNMQLKSGIAAKYKANQSQKPVTISGTLNAKPYQTEDSDFPTLFSRFALLVEAHASSYTQAQALTNAIASFQRLPRSFQDQHRAALTYLALKHFSSGEDFIGRIRYGNNFALLTGIVKESADSELLALFRSYLSETFFSPFSGESEEQFHLRRDNALALWDTARIAIFYWPDDVARPNGYTAGRAQGKDFSSHFELMDQIGKRGRDGFPPGLQYLHLIIIRDNVGATAGEGTVWLTLRASYRSFLHELGHVIHESVPAVKGSFSRFEEFFSDSKESDFITMYHTNHEEDFAETFTEYVLGGSQGIHPLDLALDRAVKGDVLLLEKFLYLFIVISGPNEESLSYFQKQDGTILQDSFSIQRDSEGRITDLYWSGDWYNVSYRGERVVAIEKR